MFICLLPAGAHAATLGKLTVLSAIGQPLNAEIELQSVDEHEKQAIAVKLAPQQAFSEANVEFNPAFGALHFAIETRGAGQVVRITSDGAFNEPFVDVLLELNGGSAPRAVREYSFLLDAPRGSQTAAAPQVAAAAAVSRPAATAAAPVKAAVGPESKADAKPAIKAASKTAGAASKTPKATSKAAGKSEYKIRPGESLSEIANRMRPAGVSLDQMLVAMYRANPDAFVGENMSRMRAGKILSVPDAATAGALARPEATSVVVAQARDFNSYRNQLAGHVAAGPAKPAGPAARAAGGKITAKVEERATPAGEARDKLQLSKAGGSDAASGGMTSEDKIAADKAAADDASRIKDLEKNVGDLQKLLEIKNQNLAELSAQKAAAAPAAATAPAETPPAPAASDPAATAATTPAEAAPESKPAPAASVPKPDLFEGWRENPMLLPGGGMVAAILIAWALYRARRKQETRKQTFSEVIPGDAASVTPEVGSMPAPLAADAELRTAIEEQAPKTPVAVVDPVFTSEAVSAGQVEAVTATEAAERQAERDAADALKIDLSRLEQSVAPAVAPAALDMDKLDFDLELDNSLHPPTADGAALPEIDLAAGLAAQPTEKQADKPAGQAIDPVTTPQSVPAPASAPAPDKPVALPPEVAGLSLDLSEPADDAAPIEEIDDELSSFSKEINTKLDLAAAYQEIGDQDGSRELLEEVLKAGNKRQVAKAQEMLGQLV